MYPQPHLRAFLRELADLESMDAERLPLPLLVNVCRGRMRQPLLNVRLLVKGGKAFNSAYKKSAEAEAILDKRYPAMAEGELVQQYADRTTVYATCIDAMNVDRDELDAALLLLQASDEVAWELVAYSADGWTSAEAAVLLYEMTCSLPVCEALAPLLDGLLGFDPIIGQMLIDLADLSTIDE